MKIISEVTGFKVELTIPDSLKREGMSDEEADRLINVAYKPFIDKITSFIAYSIGFQDFASIDRRIVKKELKEMKSMVKAMLPEPGGSYFCEICSREYEKEGTCGCGGKITFISMHSNRYLSTWMKSKGRK